MSALLAVLSPIALVVVLLVLTMIAVDRASGNDPLAR